MKVVVVSFHPVRLYPPSLSAVNNLATIYNEAIIITRNTTNFQWSYPANVREILVGDYMDIKASEKQSIVWKARQFLKYVSAVKKCIRSENPDVVLLYDFMSAFSWYLNRSVFTKMKHKVWYHNHDVVEHNSLRRFSIGWFAFRNEPKIFPFLDIFSLPSAERERYFPLNQLKGKCLIIPNYPSTTIYRQRTTPRQLRDKVKIVFAGSISEGHGLEEIIDVLHTPINGRSLELHLLGPVSDVYRESLFDRARKKGVEASFFYHGWHHFKDIPGLLEEYHIGLAINKPVGIIYSTGGTASNKIYEYPAMGMPALLYDNEHHRKYLQTFKWAFFTDCTPGSLVSQLESIVNSYERLSGEAHADFLKKLNFEVAFREVESMLLNA